ncbi:MAG: HAD family hydrolase [Firmicutes bacterium]|nr:HAD family hydrolase [Bacillota bacterium]
MDSLSTYVSALKHVLTYFNVDIRDEKIVLENMGSVVYEFFLNFLSEEGAIAASLMLDNTLIKMSDNNIKLIPGTRDTLRKLSRKAKLGLVTNSNSKFVYYNFRRLDIEQFFYKIMPGDGDSTKKTTRCMEIISNTGIDPKDTLYIGDLLSDIQTARDIGCGSCMVYNKYSWLFPNYEKAKSSGADILISDIAELLQLI